LLQTDNEAEARSIFKLCSQSQWSYSAAIDELSSVNWQDQLLPVTYRPFDRRWTVRNKHVAVHLRRRISDHLVAGENVALLTSRQTKGEPFAHVHASRLVPEVICLSSKTSNNAFAFPLYRYPEKAPSPLIPSGDSEPIRRHNLSNSLVTAICAAYDVGWVDDGSGDLVSTIGPEDVLHYVFAVLHAPSYRARFGDHLSRDFPRVPFVRDFGHFSTIANFGKKLLPLHLLESTQPAARFPFVVSGDNVVAKSRFTGSSHQAGVGRIWINQTQYFSEVPACVWEFRIGGYRVAEKWINSRAGRTLSYDDIVYFQRVLASLMEIDRLCAELDEAIADAGGWPFVDPVRAE
jgi:predicted helicase